MDVQEFIRLSSASRERGGKPTSSATQENAMIKTYIRKSKTKISTRPIRPCIFATCMYASRHNAEERGSVLMHVIFIGCIVPTVAPICLE